MTEILQEIDTKQELEKQEKKLSLLYSEFIELVILKDLESKESEGEFSDQELDYLAQRLQEEFIRVSEIGGCYEILEKLEKESIKQLSKYDYKKKKSESIWQKHLRD